MIFGRFFKTGNPGPKPSSAKASRPGDTNAGTAVAGGPKALGIALQHHQGGRIAEAEAAYRQILASDPGNFDALHLLGVAAYQLGRYDEASEHISRALALSPTDAAAQNNLGNVLRAQGRLDEALARFQKAVNLQPNYADAHISLGALNSKQGRLEEAIACYRTARSLTPNSPAVLLNLGNLLADHGKQDEAIQCYRQALAVNPDSFEAQFNLGNVLAKQGELDEAVLCYRNAIALKPDSHAAHCNLGNVLNDQNKPSDAAVCYEKAIALKPDFAEAHFNLGIALKAQSRPDQAVASYRRALALEPNWHEAYCLLGNALRDQDRFEEVLECYRKALSIKPDYAEARWNLAMSQIPAVYPVDSDPARFRAAFSMQLVELERWFGPNRVAEGYEGVGVKQPFFLAYQDENNRNLLAQYGSLCNRIMSAWLDRQVLPDPRKQDYDGVIRIGVVSRYFHNHSVWNAIVKGWFLQLDRKRFSLHAFHLGTENDQETSIARASAAYFEQGSKRLLQWVEAIMARQLDVLIYPEIGMDPMTLRLASLRLAPVQVAAWGHPDTTGLGTIDYYLSGEDLEPENAQDNYTERLIALPHLGCFYKPVPVGDAIADLRSLGIDPGSPLIVCPGVPFKYTPRHDRIIVEVARKLGECQIVFFKYQLDELSEKLRQRLQVVFARSRLDFDRLVKFIPWQSSRPRFYGLLKRADVYLDTVGFSGFNTAMQALECGLPIVTMEGRFMRGRLASGLLKRIGLPELVAASEEDYIALGVRLAEDTGFRQCMRERIEASRHVLFEDLAPIRALEDFLTGVVRR